MPNLALPADTSIEAARVQTAVWRRLGLDRSVREAVRMTYHAWQSCEAEIRRRHPNYTDQQVRLAALRLRIGEDLFKQACPGVDARP